MHRLAPKVCQWVERCQRGGNARDALLENDAIPNTLKPILAWQMRERLPVLLESAKLMTVWAQRAAANEPLPRGFGNTDITIGGYNGTCLARSFPLYRLRAVQDHYRTMSNEKKARATELLDEVGGPALRDFRLSARLARVNNQLVIAG